MKTSLICPLPWLSLAVRNDGVHRVCCHANVSEERGVLRDFNGHTQRADQHGIEQVRNSDSLKKIRQQMLAGEWPESCGRCQKEESLGLRSKRIYASEYLQRPAEFYHAATQSDGSIETARWPLEDLDLRFGNKCNLKCRMCGPSDSNAWYGDFEALNGRSYQPEGNFSWYHEPRFWDELFEQAQSLQHLYLVGGEPLLIRQHFDFLKKLAETGRASEVVLEYNSNLTVLPDEVLEIWKAFKEVKIGISMDGYSSLNDYIRHPSQFKKIEENLRKLDKAPIALTAWIATTLSIYNFLDLNDLFIWKIGMDFKKVGTSKSKPLVTPHFLHKPSHLSLKCLPVEIKSKTREAVPELRQEFSFRLNALGVAENEMERYLVHWDQIHDSILRFMESPSSEADFAKFKKWNHELDQIRGNEFQKLSSLRFQSIFSGYL